MYKFLEVVLLMALFRNSNYPKAYVIYTHQGLLLLVEKNY